MRKFAAGQTVHVGTKYKVAQLLLHNSWYVYFQLCVEMQSELNLRNIIHIRSLQLLYQLDAWVFSWERMITRTENFDATDPRDKIIALLGLRTGEPLILPDYSISVAATYRIATQAIISADDSIRILYHIKDKFLHSVTKLPSWVFDFSIRIKQGISPEKPIRYSRFKAAADSKALATWPSATNSALLVTKAYIIDTILEVAEEFEADKEEK
jgi:hypothetical protein